jgi:FkbH-like protein
MSTRKTLILSNFTLNSVKGFLRANGVEADLAPLGDIYNSVIDYDRLYADAEYEYIFVWIDPFQLFSCMSEEEQEIGRFKDDLDVALSQFVQVLAGLKVKGVMIASFTVPARKNTFSLLNHKPGLGQSYKMNLANTVLAENIEEYAGIQMLDSSPWTCQNKENSKLWYMGKIAWSNEVYKAAASDVSFTINTLRGKSAKLLLLDLDNTLWGGVVGDDGYENLRLGGIDPVGEAFKDFQKEIKALKAKGVVLGLVSKNTEAIAMEAIEKHPEMILKPEDFVTWRINWQDKASNIRSIIEEINIGDNAVVFIDDSPTERDIVERALPEVHVADFPSDPVNLPKFLRELQAFDVVNVTAEDRNKTALYQAEGKRKSAVPDQAFLADWIRDLAIKIDVKPFADKNAKRIHQLLNKTNQFNTLTRRCTEAELILWLQSEEHHLFGVSVEDKFGSYGLVGILGIALENNVAKVSDFVMSCRVMGKDIEQTLIYSCIQIARNLDANSISFEYLETPKNAPCLEALKKSELTNLENTFSWDLKQEYPLVSLHALNVPEIMNPA